MPAFCMRAYFYVGGYKDLFCLSVLNKVYYTMFKLILKEHGQWERFGMGEIFIHCSRKMNK